jgi:hypothetical protein
VPVFLQQCGRLDAPAGVWKLEFGQLIVCVSVNKRALSFNLIRQYTILLSFLILAGLHTARAQVADSLASDSTEVDSILVDLDTIYVRTSPGAPKSPIVYGSKDSLHVDVRNQLMYLYGNAKILYGKTELDAGYIRVDLQKNLITARPFPDTSGMLVGYPHFKDGDQEFTAEEMTYNYKTQKGIIHEGRTMQGDLHLVGSRTKMVMADDVEENDLIYNEDVIFSTCDHPEPHFGIRARKVKIIPDEMVIVGPANLEIAGVPTPLFLPFGFFPITETRSAGLIFPSGYEYSPTLGYGISNIGYFTPIGQTINLKLLGEIYTRGSWGLVSEISYKKRYKYSGNGTLSYRVLREEANDGVNFVRRPSLVINWSHRQEARAHPYNSLSASLRFQIDNQIQTFQTDFQSQAQNIYSSNITFTRRFPDNLFTLTTSLEHSQNTATRNVEVRFPSYSATMKRLFPFQRQGAGGKPKWYEQFSLTYNSSGLVQLNGKDTTFFSQQTLDEARYGIRHNASADINFRLLKYFNFRPATTYREDWYFRTYEEFYDTTQVVTADTIRNDNGEIVDILNDTSVVGKSEREIRGFFPLREYNFNANMDFSLFGMAQFRKFFIRGLRHTLRTNLTFSYRPDFTSERFGYFDTYEGPDGPERYSVFRPEAGLRGPSNGGRQMLLGFGFTNNVEAKVYSKRDSSLKKITLLNNFRFSGSYDLAADSFGLSKLTGSGVIRLLKNMTNININMTFDPYQVQNGRRIDRFLWQDNARLLRFERLNLRFDTDLTLDGLKSIFAPNAGTDKNADPAPEGRGITRGSSQAGSGFEDLEAIIRGLSISHDLNLEAINDPARNLDTTRVTAHNIRLSLSNLKLSSNWNMQIGNIGYDFINKRITYPDFTFSRDLHCWTMSLSVQPTFGTYQFRIGVKPGTLDFLDIPYRKNRQDASNFRF